MSFQERAHQREGDDTSDSSLSMPNMVNLEIIGLRQGTRPRTLSSRALEKLSYFMLFSLATMQTIAIPTPTAVSNFVQRYNFTHGQNPEEYGLNN